MDKRVNNGGNSTKAVREDDKRLNPFRDAIQNACSEQDVIDVLRTLYHIAVNNGNTRAAKIYLEYTLGKPKEIIELTTINETPIINIG